MLNVALLILMVGCRDNKISEEDTQDWWEADANAEDKTDESSEEGSGGASGDDDKEIGELEECPEGFDAQAPCEGSWETTICTYEGTIWWCENGAWLSEDDKQSSAHSCWVYAFEEPSTLENILLKNKPQS